MKKLLNTEDLGFVLYGRNLSNPSSDGIIREILKCGRTQLSQKKTLRTKEGITEEEVEMLKNKFVSSMLPDQWFFNGTLYLNFDGVV